MKINPLAILISILCFFYLLIVEGYLLYTSIGLAFSLFIFIDFVDKLGKIFPLKEFITLIACLQWIVGSKISYNLGKTHHKYFMYVEEDVYMSYVVPGVITMFFGFILINNNLSISRINNYFKNTKSIKLNLNVAYLLLFIGIISSILDKTLKIGGLAFIFYLASLLLYVGIGYLILLFPKYKWYLAAITIGITFISSINSGMFHNLLIISSFLGFILIPEKTSFTTKFLVIMCGFVFIYMLQVVKKDFREIIWNKPNADAIDVFYNIIEKEFLITNQETLINKDAETEKAADANNRLNQGWIISKVLENVPSRKPFLNGKTINEAIEASLLPRFLSPDKAGADKALINFKEITGLGLSEHASMGLSLIAEFYANYGVIGGWIAMFLYGILISLIIQFLLQNLGKGSPLMILWLLLFFFQIVKAETDFIKIFNHLVKSIMFFMIVNFGLSLLGIRLFKNTTQEI